jgi:hypothetical protein
MEAHLGKYFDTSDLRFAQWELAKQFPHLVGNIGNATGDSKLMRLMQYNQISRTNEETFERLDQSRVTKAFNQHFYFGGLTAGDILFKGQVLASVYHNYRLIDGKFIPKSQFKGAKKEWNEAITLYDAYEIKDKLPVPKEEFKQYITE